MAISYPEAKSKGPLNKDDDNKNAETNCKVDSKLDVPMKSITINVFFDGTGNNMFNTDLRFEDEKLLREGKERKNRDLQAEISYNNDYSNVALLYKAAEANPDTLFKIYIEGAGTIKDQKDDNGGLSAGTGPSGIMERVKDAFEQIVFKLKGKPYKHLIFNVFGFSRGSFYARYFVALLKLSPRYADKGQGPINKAYSELPVLNKTPVFDNEVARIPIRTDDYDFMENGRALLEVEPEKIIINLVGIYDTVVSHGWKHDNDSIPFKMDIGLKQQINKLVHITAQNDYRNHFALVQTNTAQKDIKADASAITCGRPVGFECCLPGAHADIGGGYVKPYMEKYANDVNQGLYLSVYDDPFEAWNMQRDAGEIYWKWYVKRGYFVTSKPDQARYEKIRTKQKDIVALQSAKVNDEEAQEVLNKKRALAEYDFYDALNQEAAVSSEDNYGLLKKEGVYGELEVVKTLQRYEVRAKRTLWHNSYQFIPLEVMYDLAETQLNAVSFTNKAGLPQLKKYFAEVQADPVLAKFRNATIEQVRSNYQINARLEVTTLRAGLTEKESQYLYHEYIHASMAAELVYDLVKVFSQYTANGGIDANKDAQYYPRRVLISDNASGVVNTKPDRPWGKRYVEQAYEGNSFF